MFRLLVRFAPVLIPMAIKFIKSRKDGTDPSSSSSSRR